MTMTRNTLITDFHHIGMRIRTITSMNNFKHFYEYFFPSASVPCIATVSLFCFALQLAVCLETTGTILQEPYKETLIKIRYDNICSSIKYYG